MQKRYLESLSRFLARSHARRALYSFVSCLTISVSFRASVLLFRLSFVLVSCPFVPCNGNEVLTFFWPLL